MGNRFLQYCLYEFQASNY